ncbi:MAG: DUF481 domain-containing protein [Thermodesulfobacteriota bacterium]|nr:DUF481 domain-containing protein [Thermodesulfobacteriota bacterium]
MWNVAKVPFFLLSAILFLMAAPLGAEQQPAPDVAQDAQAAQKKQDLGSWWLRNSLKYDPMPREFLYHIEAKYGFIKETGNVEKETHNVHALLAIRKTRFTNYLEYSLTKEDWAAEKRKVQDLHESVRMDLAKKLYGQVGWIWTIDEDRFIDDRSTYYGGFGCDLIDSKKYLLSVFGSLGREELDYMPGVSFEGIPAAGSETSTLYYLDQRFKWFITESISFSQRYEFVGNLDTSSDYRSTLNLGIEFAINTHLALRLDYQQKYYNAPPDYVKDRDEKQGLLIQISY